MIAVIDDHRAVYGIEPICTVGEADIRTVIHTACLTGSSPFATILRTVSA